jgi:hypothetical protein
VEILGNGKQKFYLSDAKYYFPVKFSLNAAQANEI